MTSTQAIWIGLAIGGIRTLGLIRGRRRWARTAELRSGPAAFRPYRSPGRRR